MPNWLIAFAEKRPFRHIYANFCIEATFTFASYGFATTSFLNPPCHSNVTKFTKPAAPKQCKSMIKMQTSHTQIAQGPVHLVDPAPEPQETLHLSMRQRSIAAADCQPAVQPQQVHTSRAQGFNLINSLKQHDSVRLGQQFGS